MGLLSVHKTEINGFKGSALTRLFSSPARQEGEVSKAKLRKYCSKSKNMGLWLEVKWAKKKKKNENGWFRGTLESEKVYEGKSMFSFPKRQGLLNFSVCLLKLSFQRKSAYKVTKRASLPQATMRVETCLE